MDSESLLEELQGYTVERLKELCSVRGIKFAGKTKEELISLLGEKMAKESTKIEFSDSLMKMVLQMQEQQLQMQKETRTWIAQQQERQEKLMQAVIDRSSLTASGEDGAKKAKPPKPTLQKLAPSDDIESFIDMFERVATQQGWSTEVWSTQLAGLLSGDALDAFTSIPLSEANDYSKVRAAILSRYEVNAETYQIRFRDNMRKPNESYKMFLSRLSDQLTRWIKATEMDLQELVLLEQFLKTLPRDLAVWLKEQKPTCATKAAEMADDYEVARKSESRPSQLQSAPTSYSQFQTGGASGSAPSQKGPQRPMSTLKPSSAVFQPQRSKTNHRGEIQCHWCKEWGHIQAMCPQRQLQSGVKATSKPAYLSTNTESGCEDRFVKDARLDSEPIKILLDTGSKMSIVKADLVNQSRWNTEDRVPIQCVHGDQLTYPTADVLLEIDGWSRILKVALVPQMPVDMIVGAGDYCPDGFLPTLAQKNDGPSCLMVTTRSQSKKINIAQEGPVAGTSDNSPESKSKRSKGNSCEGSNEMSSCEVSDVLSEDNETSPGEGDVLSESNEMSSGEGSDVLSEDNSCGSSKNNPIICESHTSTDAGNSDACSDGNVTLCMTDHEILQATAEQLKHWQQDDDSLREVRRVATLEEIQITNHGRATFFYKEGILYRRWVPRKLQNRDLKTCEQLVLPLRCRSVVMQMGHDAPMAGHLGVNKTRNRILNRYYWPGIFKDISTYCRSCEVCQRSQRRGASVRAEMISMPLIGKPFQRIAMDVVGPLPKSKSGNRFILTICDYATRYPEAIPLPSTEAERVAKELIKLFSRVGIPDEILTDQGSNFMSSLLQETYSLLQIRRIRTSPYHPQMDGLVERFNGTLKSMLKKFTSKNQKDWDEYLPFLLFAYREVPQESTGFSPFELLFGRRVRGPLDVLRECWTDEKPEDTPVIPYVLDMQKKLREMTGVAQTSLQVAQQRQKEHYDQKAVHTGESLEVGDEVLVLLPARRNKLQLEWAGPYKITRKVSPVDVEVDTPGKRSSSKIYHVNLLRKWYSGSYCCFSLLQDRCGEDVPLEQTTAEAGVDQAILQLREDEELLDWRTLEGAEPPQLPGLTTTQKNDILKLLAEFPTVTGGKLGRTTVVEHKVHVEGGQPIHQQPYQVAVARRDVLKKELDKMLEQGVIRASTSPWASPLVLVDKRDGGIRLCVDYRKVNKMSKFDAYPMPHVQEILDEFWPIGKSTKCLSSMHTQCHMYKKSWMRLAQQNSSQHLT